MNSQADEHFSTVEMVLFALEKCKLHGWVGKETICLEPSSGDGIFLEHFKDSIHSMTCLDISPKHDECIEMDFLKYDPERRFDLVVGNPPFGRRNQLATLFVNKAMKVSDRCVFILPLSFLRPSTIDSIDQNVWIKEFYPLPTTHFRRPNSPKFKKIGAGLFFLERRNKKRQLFKNVVNIKEEPRSSRPGETPEYAIIHSGGGTGKIVDVGSYSKGTTYSLVGKKNLVQSMDWTQLSRNGSAGQLSITLTDIHLAIKMKEMGLDYHTGALGYLKHIEK